MSAAVETVYTITDYYDGPVTGIADLDGQPALPADRARHDAIKPALREVAWTRLPTAD